MLYYTVQYTTNSMFTVQDSAMQYSMQVVHTRTQVSSSSGSHRLQYNINNIILYFNFVLLHIEYALLDADDITTSVESTKQKMCCTVLHEPHSSTGRSNGDEATNSFFRAIYLFLISKY